MLFYVLLLALAEHIGFMAAYGAAAVATTALVSTYCAKLLASRLRGGLIAGLLSTVFGLLFLFLQMEDFALLAGAIFAFVVLAVVMFSTASLDWTGRGNAALALGYNAIVIPLAVMGTMSPLLAALTMTASSLLAIANSLRVGKARPLAAPIRHEHLTSGA